MRPEPVSSHADRQAAIAAALLDRALAPPDGLLAPGGGPIGRRFAVHRATATLGLVSALATRHPVLERMLGAETFADLALAFVATDRPRTALLIDWGSGLPDFVAAHPDLADWPWLADVARLEVAWNEAHHAAEAVPVTIAALAALDPEALAGARIVAHPSLRLVETAWPVAALWAANGEAETIAPGAEFILVLRPDADVTVHSVDRAGHAFAAALAGGATIAAAAEAALSIDEAFDVGARLVALVRLGAVAAIRCDRPEEDPRSVS